MLTDQNLSAIVDKFSKTEKIVDHNISYDKWNITHLYGSTLWVKRLDEPDADSVIKGGIVLTVNQAKGLYAIGQVIMAGSDVKYAKPGQYILFPATGYGQSAQKVVDGFKTYFIREDSVMAVVSFDGDESEIPAEIEREILLG
jgi:hypothetical protein